MPSASIRAPYNLCEFGANPAGHRPDHHTGHNAGGVMDIEIEPGECNQNGRNQRWDPESISATKLVRCSVS